MTTLVDRMPNKDTYHTRLGYGRVVPYYPGSESRSAPQLIETSQVHRECDMSVCTTVDCLG